MCPRNGWAGAGGGAAVGFSGGALWGGMNGFYRALTKEPDTPDYVLAGQTAEEGMIIGVGAGVLGPLARVPVARPSVPSPTSCSCSAGKNLLGNFGGDAAPALEGAGNAANQAYRARLNESVDRLAREAFEADQAGNRVLFQQKFDQLMEALKELTNRGIPPQN